MKINKMYVCRYDYTHSYSNLLMYICMYMKPAYLCCENFIPKTNPHVGYSHKRIDTLA